MWDKVKDAVGGLVRGAQVNVAVGPDGRPTASAHLSTRKVYPVEVVFVALLVGLVAGAMIRGAR